jgi:hypothetical protein
VYFHVVIGSLLIFRANSVHQVADFIVTIFTNFGGTKLHLVPPLPTTLLAIPIFLVLDFIAYRKDSERFFDAWWPAARGTLYALLFVLVLMGWSNEPAEFIYFKF